MSVTSFAGETKVTANQDGSVTISQQEDNWGSARPVQTISITVKDGALLLRALEQVVRERGRDYW